MIKNIPKTLNCERKHKIINNLKKCKNGDSASRAYISKIGRKWYGDDFDIQHTVLQTWPHAIIYFKNIHKSILFQAIQERGSTILYHLKLSLLTEEIVIATIISMNTSYDLRYLTLPAHNITTNVLAVVKLFNIELTETTVERQKFLDSIFAPKIENII